MAENMYCQECATLAKGDCVGDKPRPHYQQMGRVFETNGRRHGLNYCRGYSLNPAMVPRTFADVDVDAELRAKIDASKEAARENRRASAAKPRRKPKPKAETEKPAPAVEGEKQAWEMTKAEYAGPKPPVKDKAKLLADLNKRKREVRAEYKGVKRVSFMNRTTPKIARGQELDRALLQIEQDRTRISRMGEEWRDIEAGSEYESRLSDHRIYVQRAIDAGKPAPRNVLEEYKSEPWAAEALSQKPAEGEKEAWEMAQGEWAEDQWQSVLRRFSDRPDILDAKNRAEEIGHFKELHAGIVLRAAEEGQAIPAEVLADYPGIKKPAPVAEKPEPKKTKTKEERIAEHNLASWKAQIITKMREMEIRDFSDSELHRVYSGTVAEDRLIEMTRLLVDNGDLKLKDVCIATKAKIKAKAKTVAQTKIKEAQDIASQVIADAKAKVKTPVESKPKPKPQPQDDFPELEGLTDLLV